MYVCMYVCIYVSVIGGSKWLIPTASKRAVGMSRVDFGFIHSIPMKPLDNIPIDHSLL